MIFWRTPSFWYRKTCTWRAHMLRPASWLFGFFARRHYAPRADRYHSPTPLITIGNATAGGAGKTPLTLSLAHLATKMDARVHLVGHGYGASIKETLQVCPRQHDWRMVGDEALLLARYYPTWIGERTQAIRAASQGADIVIMDGGLYDPHLKHDWGILVAKGDIGFGNGLMIPAGPMRHSIAHALALPHSLMVIGEDSYGMKNLCPPHMDYFTAGQELSNVISLDKKRVLPLCAIAHPQSFFAMLKAQGAIVTETIALADHAPIHRKLWMRAAKRAQETKSRLVVTAKDAVKLPPLWYDDILIMDVAITWTEAVQKKLEQKIESCLKR